MVYTGTVTVSQPYNVECISCGYREEHVWLRPNEQLKCPRCRERAYITKEVVEYDD